MLGKKGEKKLKIQFNLKKKKSENIHWISKNNKEKKNLLEAKLSWQLKISK